MGTRSGGHQRLRPSAACDPRGGAASAVEDGPEVPRGAATTLRVTVQRLSGEVLLAQDLPGSLTVSDLVGRMQLYGSCSHSLVHGPRVLPADSEARLEELLEGAKGSEGEGARLTLVSASRPAFKVSARCIGGTHTNNSECFSREKVGTEDEFLRLKNVCWFQVGGNLRDVLPGKYKLTVVAAKTPQFSLFGEAFEVSVGGKTVARWAADRLVTEEFKEYGVAEVEVEEQRDVKVELNLWDRSRKSGFLLKAICLK